MPKFINIAIAVLRTAGRCFLLYTVIFIFVAQGSCFVKAATPLSQSGILEKMRELKPLPKMHYTWGMWYQFEDCNESLLYQLARINHSLCVKGEWATQSQIEKCVYACAKANMLKPPIPSSIGINYSPWHRKFGKDLPPTDRGPTYREEIEEFAGRLRLIGQFVEKSNSKYKSNVAVSAILLDCERFLKKDGNEKWNRAMCEALDAIHRKALEIFPNARIEWYGRGMSGGIYRPDFSQTPYWTGDEIKPSLSCALYCLPEANDMRETYSRTVKLADRLKVKSVTPWVALASGYRRGLVKPLYWEDDWDYDLTFSYNLGEELNNSLQMGKTEVIVFFPAPFERKTPNWGKHFIAYVRGAAGNSEVKDLGYSK